ncbi:MAG: ferrous iron transport protein A [Lachnospiraceae bacterium]|nr:ferrous iron transport protein A [Lachnospiraceae bacterium]
MMPLSLADRSVPQTVKHVGGSKEVRKHLENLGFVPGTEIMVVSELAGNLIVKVKEARVAISDELARKIMI